MAENYNHTVCNHMSRMTHRVYGSTQFGTPSHTLALTGFHALPDHWRKVQGPKFSTSMAWIWEMFRIIRVIRISRMFMILKIVFIILRMFIIISLDWFPRSPRLLRKGPGPKVLDLHDLNLRNVQNYKSAKNFKNVHDFKKSVHNFKNVHNYKTWLVSTRSQIIEERSRAQSSRLTWPEFEKCSEFKSAQNFKNVHNSKNSVHNFKNVHIYRPWLVSTRSQITEKRSRAQSSQLTWPEFEKFSKS